MESDLNQPSLVAKSVISLTEIPGWQIPPEELTFQDQVSVPKPIDDLDQDEIWGKGKDPKQLSAKEKAQFQLTY